MVTLFVSRGADYAQFDVRRKAGRADYAQIGGLAAGRHGCRLETEKNANMTFAFFSSAQPTATAVGCPSPFEHLKDGFVTVT